MGTVEAFQNKDQQFQRNQEQGTLLAQIESLHTADASKLVGELRVDNRRPSDADIAKLKILQKFYYGHSCMMSGIARLIVICVSYYSNNGLE